MITGSDINSTDAPPTSSDGRVRVFKWQHCFLIVFSVVYKPKAKTWGTLLTRCKPGLEEVACKALVSPQVTEER